MILFLNFAPFNFGGGAERWMIDVSSTVNKLETVTLVDVHERLANIYGQLILKRKFNKRLTLETNNKHVSLVLRSFLPFRSEWYQARKNFKNARIIYIRYELLELLIVLYLGGISGLKKTIAGIHSPFIYQNPVTFFDYMHNFIYNSFTSRLFLSQMKKIHVISPKDYKIFTEEFDLKNVAYVPNYVALKENFKNKSNKRNNQILNIAFVGELNIRKGVDILIETIKQSPDNYIFHIAGDGQMKKDIEELNSFKNVKYYGYLSKQDLVNFYADSDILFAPSRAESFSLAGLEGMSYGLPLISSSDTNIGLPTSIQIINSTGTTKEYIKIFGTILEKKKRGELDQQKKDIREYTQKNFSRDSILSKLEHEILEIVQT